MQGLLSNYEGSNTVVNNQSVLLGVQRRAAADGFSVTYSLGCDTLCNSTEGFDESAATASKADLVLLVVGLSRTLSVFPPLVC